MLLRRVLLGSSVVLLAAAGVSAASTHSRRGPTAPKLGHKKVVKAVFRPTSQRTIDDERASTIQTALIRSGYLNGEGTGHWDAETSAAMQRYQADHGWQTKLIPDSRAIIALGLGPSQGAADTAGSSASVGLAAESTASSVYTQP